MCLAYVFALFIVRCSPRLRPFYCTSGSKFLCTEYNLR
jgi:hypothetical protein